MNVFAPLFLWLAFIFCPLATLLFVVRLVAALFSPKVSEQMWKHPTFHMIWGCFAFVGVLFILGFLNPEMWPPISVERREQRGKIMDRVQSAGGWDAIRRDCIALAEQNTNGFYSHWHDTNLPPEILALKLMTVEYSPNYGCVSMRIFGMHSTGGHSTPYFGLEVDTSTNSASYKHGAGYDNGGVIGNHHSVAEQVADGIYEIY
jgi:hypothetical protein